MKSPWLRLMHNQVALCLDCCDHIVHICDHIVCPALCTVARFVQQSDDVVDDAPHSAIESDTLVNALQK